MRNQRRVQVFVSNRQPAWEVRIQYQKIIVPEQKRRAAPRVHRYRSSRPWSVAGLAAAAASGAVWMMATISTTLGGTHPLGGFGL